MNQLRTFEDLRPEVRPLTPAQVDALRAHLFDGVGLPGAGAVDVDERLDDGTHDVVDLPLSDVGHRVRRRRAWLVGVAAATVAVLGVAGIWTLTGSRPPGPSEPAQQPGAGATPAPVSAPAAPPAPAGSSVTSTTAPHTALDAAMEPDGVVLVVNGSGVAGLGDSLTDAIEGSGYAVRPPVDATEPVSESIVYFRDDAPAAIVGLLVPAIPVSRGEQLISQHVPVASTQDVDEADVIIVLGADLADAPWSSGPTPLVPNDPGVLLVLDGTGTPNGHQRTESQIATLTSLGIDVVDGGATTQPIGGSMLMPIGTSTRWTFAIAELAGIGGFDSWSPALLDGDLPADVTAVLVVGA